MQLLQTLQGGKTWQSIFTSAFAAGAIYFLLAYENADYSRPGQPTLSVGVSTRSNLYYDKQRIGRAEAIRYPRAHSMTKSVVAVSAETLFLAESNIVGCANCCTDRVTTSFERLLDIITGLPATTRYILPGPAICPRCYNHVQESTMVLTSDRRKKHDNQDSSRP